ncbi:MAG: hypothetical protein IPH35_18390 [Rhodoferax sp.]|nr:hypothetical protein [Rhodoferax sp.]
MHWPTACATGFFCLCCPPILVIGSTVGLGYLFWDAAMDQVRLVLESSIFVNHGWAWLTMWAGSAQDGAGPLIVIIFTVTPLIIVSLLVVSC